MASNLSSSTHFLSPETTLPPYDEIHFLNNQFSTHVECFFLKCSAAVLSFQYLEGNLDYQNLVFSFRQNQRFSQVSNHQERAHKLSFFFYYYYCFTVFSKGLILLLCRQICVPGDLGNWMRLQNWPFFLILQGKNACLWSTNRADEKEPCAQGGTGSNVELIYLLSLIKCSLFLEILLYKSHQSLTTAYPALQMRD